MNCKDYAFKTLRIFNNFEALSFLLRDFKSGLSFTIILSNAEKFFSNRSNISDGILSFFVPDELSSNLAASKKSHSFAGSFVLLKKNF